MRKTFFKTPTPAQVKRLDAVAILPEETGLADIVQQIDAVDGQKIVICESPVPEQYQSARKFMKHGPEITIPRAYSLQQIVERNKTPVQLREKAFAGQTPGVQYCGYSFAPVLGNDRKKRRVSLVECINGAKLYAYAASGNCAPITVKPYDNAHRVTREGAAVIVDVPSRTKGEQRYRFKMESVPVIDNPLKYAVAQSISSDHQCGSTRFNIKYNYAEDKQDSKVFNVCAHEVAAYLAIIDHYWNSLKNLVPLQMSQFAIPTQETVDFEGKLNGNVLLAFKEDEKLKHRKLNMAEREILHWERVRQMGHDATFFAREKVKDYKW